MLLKLNEKSRFKQFLGYNNPVVLFGAGSFGIIILNYLKKFNIKVDYFCDNDSSKVGQYMNSIKIISVDELLNLNRDISIVITSTYFDEIYKQLDDMGFKRLFCFSSWFTMEHYNNVLYDSIENNIGKINKVFEMLADEKSKEVFTGILNYRLTFDIKDLMKCVSKNEMYFDKDIMNFQGEIYFVDGGAYDGETILKFIEATKGNFKSVYSFEPDQCNFELLKNNKDISKYSSKIKLENKGLYKQTGKVYFSSINDQGSCISEARTEDFINVVSIDDYAANNKITFIKMDIEGAEIDAINGAVKTLKIEKPKLSVCLYHKINDLWEIPLLIKSIQPDYKIYLRQYAYTLFDTVCYAI